MSYLSRANKTEYPFESFYGTDLAGREVVMLEMNEEQVCNICGSMGAEHNAAKLYMMTR